MVCVSKTKKTSNIDYIYIYIYMESCGTEYSKLYNHINYQFFPLLHSPTYIYIFYYIRRTHTRDTD